MIVNSWCRVEADFFSREKWGPKLLRLVLKNERNFGWACPEAKKNTPTTSLNSYCRWWLNHPSEKYARVKLDHFPRGENRKPPPIENPHQFLTQLEPPNLTKSPLSSLKLIPSSIPNGKRPWKMLARGDKRSFLCVNVKTGFLCSSTDPLFPPSFPSLPAAGGKGTSRCRSLRFEALGNRISPIPPWPSVGIDLVAGSTEFYSSWSWLLVVVKGWSCKSQLGGVFGTAKQGGCFL